MTKLGDINTQEQLFHEAHLFASLGGTMGASQSLTYQLATYTMPMAGTLSAVILVGVSWSNGAQDVGGHLNSATPGATSGFAFQRSGNAFDGRGMILIGKMLYFWDSLAAGTVVTVNATIYNGPFATVTTVMWADGWLRSCKT